MTAQYTELTTGITHVYLQQTFDGLAVANTSISVEIAADGQVISASGGFVPDLAKHLGDAVTVNPSWTPIEAVRWATAALEQSPTLDQPISPYFWIQRNKQVAADMALPASAQPVVTEAATGLDRETVIAAPISADPIPVKLQYVPTSDGGAVLAWDMVIRTTDAEHWYDLSIVDGAGGITSLDDAATGPNINMSGIDSQMTLLNWDNANMPVFANQWIVHVEGITGTADAQVAQINGLLKSLNEPFVALQQLGADGTVLIQTPEGMPYQQIQTELMRIGTLDDLTPNFVVFADYVPNDPDFSQEWGLQNTGQSISGQTGIANDDISATKAWNISLGSPNVVVGVIDTGIDFNQPDLQQNIYTNPYETAGNGVDDDGNGYVDDVHGWNFVSNNNNPQDDNEHGTHTSGTIAAEGNNGIGVSGVAPDVSLMPLKFLNSSGSGSEANALAALNYANHMHDEGVNIVETSNSWGGGAYDSSFETAIQGSQSRNMLFVVAAGNNASNNDAIPEYPSSYPEDNVISVAASDNQDNKPSFSDYGATSVDIAAPGVNVLSTIPVADGSYAYLSGTSMATPHVAGAAALLWSVYPNASYQTIRNAIFNGGDPIAAYSTTGSTPISTGKRLDVYGAFQQIGLSITTSNPGNGAALAADPLSYTLTVNSAIDPATLQASDLTVNGIPATGVSYTAGSTTITFTFSSDPITANGSQSLQVAAGAFAQVGSDFPVAAYSATFRTGMIAFPGTFTAAAPLGSRVYTASTSAAIVDVGDTAGYTVTLDPGQTVSAIVTPTSGTLKPRITITAPGGITFTTSSTTATSSAAGTAVALNSIIITQSGTYNFIVDSPAGTTGGYTLELILNAAAELESNGGTANNTIATAQSIAPALNAVGATSSLGAVRGTFDGSVATAETEPNDTTATATPAATTFGAYSGNVYQLSISGNLSPTGDQDYYNIGSMQAGDVLTIAEMGSPSDGGTLPDAYVYLYRAGSTSVVTSNDDGGVNGGSGGDSLIYQYTITTADTYYIEAYSYQGQSAGTYLLNVYLQNTSTAPTTTTSSAIVGETESNNTMATANNVAADWRSVQYFSTLSGTISTTSDIDTYAYTFTAGDLISINARPTTGSAFDGQVHLLSASGSTLLLDNGTSTNASGTLLPNAPLYAYRIPSTGTYYIQVQSADSTTGAYALDVYLSTTTAPPTPFDYYAIPLTAGQTLTLGLKADTPATETLDLYDGNGNALATSTTTATNYDRTLSYTATSSTTDYIKVTGSNTSAYTLVAAVNAALDAEPNDTFAQAQSLGSAPVAVGALSGNDDWFTINLNAGTTFTASTSTPGDGSGQFVNTLDPRLELYTPADVLLAGDSNSAADGRNADLSVPITATGLYRIRVTAENGTSGEYALTTSTGPADTVTSVVVNGGAVQRSRLTTITVNFQSPITVSALTGLGAITLTRTASYDPTAVGTVVQTGAVTDANGAHGLITVTSGSGLASSITLTFSNTDGSGVTAGVEYASLADGDWQLAIPTLGYASVAGDPNIRRLFGDINGDGTVDALGDELPFGAAFGTTAGDANYVAAFDFNNDGTIDALGDQLAFGARFGVTLP